MHCDGYAGYNAVEDVTLVYCLAHARRKFFEALPKNNEDLNSPGVFSADLQRISRPTLVPIGTKHRSFLPRSTQVITR
jgi:hypothetical protein